MRNLKLGEVKSFALLMFLAGQQPLSRVPPCSDSSVLSSRSSFFLTFPSTFPKLNKWDPFPLLKRSYLIN